MVLHLLGKKSWNVYNTANVERVRRDEAEAQAREEAEEQRMQDEDAARRIAILRGEPVTPLLPDAATSGDLDARGDAKARRNRDEKHDGPPHERKRRKMHGEDDTDREIRFAREDVEAGRKAKTALVKKKVDDAPLIDHAGHLQLIPAPDEKAIRKAGKNDAAEAEKAQKRKREEDQVTMRFSNAAGFKNGMEKPWYASNKLAGVEESGASKTVVLTEVNEKDVWDHENPRRKDRERSRTTSGDPFAAMKHAQRQLKQSSFDKERWQRERMAELEGLRKTEEKQKRLDRRRELVDDAGLDGFSLDNPPISKRERGHRDTHRRHHHHHRSSEQLHEGRATSRPRSRQE
ncbi:hypothetical protein LTR12_007570 [Friedmanniomyces endolithicus]|nr:hypothetical protein LTR12_007570 [Friedmanniomyces endolithicus]